LERAKNRKLRVVVAVRAHDAMDAIEVDEYGTVPPPYKRFLKTSSIKHPK
jgi:hypothetical protein